MLTWLHASVQILDSHGKKLKFSVAWIPLTKLVILDTKWNENTNEHHNTKFHEIALIYSHNLLQKSFIFNQLKKKVDYSVDYT